MEYELPCEECERQNKEGGFRKRGQIKIKIKHKNERREKRGEEYNIVTNVITFIRLVKVRSAREQDGSASEADSWHYTQGRQISSHLFSFIFEQTSMLLRNVSY